MNRRVDEVPGSVDRLFIISVDGLTVFVDENQIAWPRHRKVSAKWVRPVCIWVFGIADRDVGGHALVKAAGGEGAEGCAHVRFYVGAVDVDCWEVFCTWGRGEWGSRGHFLAGVGAEVAGVGGRG